jgi:hypothetical protein
MATTMARRVVPIADMRVEIAGMVASRGTEGVGHGLGRETATVGTEHEVDRHNARIPTPETEIAAMKDGADSLYAY